uniref:Uncharacterized protein n=1 Tax=Romanomermis culicivorax TaxID=13658 RepID=A0A915HK31_ROMCU
MRTKLDKRDGTFELELVEWASRIPIIEKNRSDNKRSVYANRYFMGPIVFRNDSFPVSSETDSVTKKKNQDVREKVVLVKTSSMRDISRIKDDDDDDSKMIPLGIIPTRYKIPKKHEENTSTPVSIDSTTPVLEIKKDRLCNEHGEPIRDIRAYQFSLFRR